MTTHWSQDNLAEIRQGLRKIVPKGVGFAVCDPRDVLQDVNALWADERPAIANAGAKRRRDFIAGRVMARQAMAAIGLPEVAIPMAADRAPVWPVGLVGSISHCDSLCVAVVARTSDLGAIGIDVEENTALEPELWAEICTPQEIAWLQTQPPANRGPLVKQIFSAKEAVYKALYPSTRQFLEFSDVTIDPEQSRASCRVVENRILSVWADQGQAPWFCVNIPAEPTCA